jgi:hypothetical protein
MSADPVTTIRERPVAQSATVRRDRGAHTHTSMLAVAQDMETLAWSACVVDKMAAQKAAAEEAARQEAATAAAEKAAAEKAVADRAAVPSHVAQSTATNVETPGAAGVVRDTTLAHHTLLPQFAPSDDQWCCALTVRGPPPCAPNRGD